MNDNAQGTPEITLGFTRGVAPSKWVRRWQAVSPEQPLTIMPFPKPYGRPGNAADFDMLLERTAPGASPVGAVADGERTHHALRLYTEAVALVLPKGHDLAGEESISLAVIAERSDIRLLDHPNHAPEWPAAEPWDDPSWMPADLRGALELVATGLGGILMPAPLARHITDKRSHISIRVSDPIPGGEIWASWLVERDAPDVQHLAGVMRGRTARSSRSSEHNAENAAAAAARAPKRQQQPQKKQPKLNPNSRGAQLKAAQEKRERERAERRRAKRR